MTPGGVEHVWAAALALLDAQRVPFVVMGGLAVNVWGIPRTTFDLDFAVSLPRERLPAFLAAAEEAGFFFDEPFARGFVEMVGGRHPLVVIQCWAGGRAVHVDLFLAETPFLREAFERAAPIELEGEPRKVITAADLILLKLLAWRGKDRPDIQNILTVQGVPEEERLRQQAERLGVLERLELALREFRNE